MNLFETLSAKLKASAVAAEVSSTSKDLLQQSLRKLDLVTREEFAAQAAILARSEERVRQLEEQLQALEEQLKQLSH